MYSIVETRLYEYTENAEKYDYRKVSNSQTPRVITSFLIFSSYVIKSWMSSSLC